MRTFALTIQLKLVYEYSPGHCLTEHIKDLPVDPTHGFPLLDGAGDVHVLVIICIPTPHVVEHLVQAAHLPQPPSTITSNLVFEYK